MVDTSFDLDHQFTPVSSDALKFNLFVKTREIQQIAAVLEDVLKQPQPARQKWLAENEETVSGLLDEFMDDASGVFDGLMLEDSEILDLSVQFVTSVRSVMSILQGISSDR